MSLVRLESTSPTGTPAKFLAKFNEQNGEYAYPIHCICMANSIDEALGQAKTYASERYGGRSADERNKGGFDPTKFGTEFDHDCGCIIISIESIIEINDENAQQLLAYGVVGSM